MHRGPSSDKMPPSWDDFKLNLLCQECAVGLGVPSLAISKCCIPETPNMQLAGCQRHKTEQVPLLWGLRDLAQLATC